MAWAKPKSGPSRPDSSADAESLAIRERKLMEYEAELAKREALVERKEVEREETARSEAIDRTTEDDHQDRS